MNRFFRALGVDYLQWRALIRAHLFVDYAAILGAYGNAAAGKAIWQLAGLFIGLGILGGGPAFLILVADDPLFGAAVMTTTIGALVAFMALHESTAIVMPRDYDIIGFRPVSSRTYFAVRVTAVLWRSVEVAVPAGYLSCAAFLAREDGSVLVAAAAAGAVLFTAFSVTFVLVAGHTWLVRRVSPARVPIVAGYVIAASATLFSLSMILGMMEVVNTLMPDAPGFRLAALHIPRTALSLAIPPVWFGSYVELARGLTGRFELAAASLSVLVLAGSTLALRGRLSAQYAAWVTEVATSASSKPGSASWEWRRLRNEARAVALVAVSQLRRDMSLHTGLASSLLMVVGFFFIGPYAGFGEDGLTDPFLRDSAGGSGSFVLVYAASMVPMFCRDALITSGSADASWLFFTTPADRVRLATAMRDVTTVFILLPLMLVIAVVLIVAFEHVGHALVHATVLSMIAYNVFQAVVLVSPAMPFSQPSDRSRVSFLPSLARVPIILAAVSVLTLFERALYPSLPRTFAGLAVLALVALGLSVWTRRRLARRMQALTYAG